jgi:hypothetical protein
MHWTVKPGMYCIFLPQRPQSSAKSGCGQGVAAPENSELPLAAKTTLENPGKTLGNKKCSGKASLMAGIVARAACGVKRKGYQVLWSGCGRVENREDKQNL